MFTLYRDTWLNMALVEILKHNCDYKGDDNCILLFVLYFSVAVVFIWS